MPSPDEVKDYYQSRGGLWTHVARPEQLEPRGVDWDTWLLLAGRGFGKTRTGAEWVVKQASIHPGSRGALVAPTAADTRDIMVEGESGILACAPPGLCAYEPSKRRVSFTNGSVLTLYSADEPDRLRGPQHHFAWADELASWRRLQRAWDMLQMTMRLGDHPRVCVTTTPRPIPLVKQLVKDQRCFTVRGSTYDNLHNLAPTFRDAVVARYEGTVLGRQELHADIIDDMPGALVSRETIEAHRVEDYPDLERTVIGLDPAGTGTGDRAGIVAVGYAQGHCYVLGDVSAKLSARQTAARAWAMFDEYDADALVYETNFGKDWLTEVLTQVWHESHGQFSTPPLRPVTAVKGKKLRAQPIAMRYEQGKIHHVGDQPELEDELCVIAGTLIETNQGHVPIEDVTTDHRVMTREGWAPVAWAGKTGDARGLVGIHVLECVLWTTPEHPVYDATHRRFVPARSVQPGQLLGVRHSPASTAFLSHGVAGGTASQGSATTGTLRALSFTGLSLKRTTGPLPMACTCTTATITRSIISCGTSNCSQPQSTSRSTHHGDSGTIRLSSAVNAGKVNGSLENRSSGSVSDVAIRTGQPVQDPRTVVGTAEVRRTASVPVYNLTVADGYLPEYYANGILVHNCTWVPEESPNSPDRVDALVHAATDLVKRERSMVELAMPPHARSVAVPARNGWVG